jgi:hypothetical protein
MPWAELEPTIPAFERAKTVHALDRPVTVIGVASIQSTWFKIKVPDILFRQRISAFRVLRTDRDLCVGSELVTAVQSAYVLACNAVQIGRITPALQRNKLLPFSGSKIRPTRSRWQAELCASDREDEVKVLCNVYRATRRHAPQVILSDYFLNQN